MEGKKKTSWVTRLVALVVCFLIAMVTLVLTFGAIALIPYGSGLWLKDVVGIQIEQGVTLSSFNVSELVVLLMVWFLPSLGIVGVILMILRKVFHIAWKYVKRVLIRAFAKQAIHGEEQKQDEYSVAS